MTVIKKTLLLSMLALVVAAGVVAQAPANLRGIVTDPSGAGVPGATVTVNGPNGLVRVVATGGTGAYTINGLPPGTYIVRIAASGFTLSETNDVELVSARLSTIDAPLALATDRQEITVADALQVGLDPSNK